MNTSTEICPSLEDLAAFLEGRLSGDERARIVAHLADCPDCYEVFADAARFELSEEGAELATDTPATIEVPREPLEDPPPGKVVPFPSRPVFRWVSSIAAVLAMVAVGIPLYRQYYTPPEMNSGQLVIPTIFAQAKDDFWDRSIARGEEESGIDTSSPEFLIGARIIHLSGHLSLNDQVTALNDLAGINRHVRDLGLLIPKEQAEAFKRIQRKLDAGQRPVELIPELAKVEDELTRNVFPVKVTLYFSFGKWTEAGRLSTLAQSPNFFEAPKNQKFLRAALHHGLRDDNLDTEVATTLEEIQETLATTAPSSLPYAKLQQQFEKILIFYQNKSQEGLESTDSSPAP